MNHSYDQLQIDLFVARRENLVPQAKLDEVLSKHPLGVADPRRLSTLLVAEGISKEVAVLLDQKGLVYAKALEALGRELPAANQAESDKLDADNPDYDTLMETAVGATQFPDSPRGFVSEAVRAAGSLHSEHRYHKIEPHAEGGLGQVWVASDQELNRKVALKEIQPTHADDLGCRARFVREAEITGGLEHPGIVPVYGLGCHPDGRPFYAMRFIEGQTLKQAIDELFRDAPQRPFRDGAWRIKFRRVLNRFLDVCNTLHYAHSRHVIHRDIKPSNIMLGAFGETLVVDWGLAKSLVNDSPTESAIIPNLSGEGSSDLTILGTAVGTPAYMSPEQADGGREIPVGVASDIYSLGATLFHLLAGVPPLGDSEAQVDTSQMRNLNRLSPRTIRSDLPTPLESICRKAIAERPEDRFNSAEELAVDIENWLGDQPVAAHRETVSERMTRWVRLHPTLVVSTVVAGILLIAAAMAGLSFRNQYRMDLASKQQEQDNLTELHRQQVRASVEAAQASALIEIRNSRFEAAIEFLDAAVLQLETEPNLASMRPDIDAMLQRTRQLVDFYRYMEMAEELTFQDSSRRSSILFQRALMTAGVFKQLEWWNALPSQDLDPPQVHRLRTEVYRAMFLLTALRLKETIPADLNVAEMFKLVSAESQSSNQASIVIFNLLDAYQQSQGAEVGRRFAEQRIQMLNQLIQGVTLRQKTIEWEAKNASDLYVMGTALAYLASNTNKDQRRPFETVLGVGNALEASREMLTEAADLQRDHFWTQLVRAFFENMRGEYEAAHRSYSHAISLKPDHWIGYAWLGRDMLQYAVTLEVGSHERTIAHQRAVRNLERAIDLKPDSRIAHFTRGNALSWMMHDPREVLSSYRRALSLQEPLTGIRDSVVEQVDRRDLKAIRDWCEQVGETQPDNDEVFSCIAWAEWLLGEVELATAAANKALELKASDRVSQLIVAKADSRAGRTEQAEEALARICGSNANWFHALFARAENAERAGEFARAALLFRQAFASSESHWQAFDAKRSTARVLLLSGTEADAVAEIVNVVELSLTEPLDGLLKIARTKEMKQATELLEAFDQQLRPILQLTEKRPIVNPPLLNGDFELGLTTCWGDTLDKIELPAWQRFGGSLAMAAVTSGASHSGEKSLHITNPGGQSVEAYAELSQQFPVDVDTAYVLSAWVQSTDCGEEAIEFLVNGSPVLSVPAGSYPWREIHAEFQSTSRIVEFEIRCQDAADARLDSIVIRRR